MHKNQRNSVYWPMVRAGKCRQCMLKAIMLEADWGVGVLSVSMDD